MNGAHSIGQQPLLLLLQGNEGLGDGILHLPVYRALKLALPTHRIVGLSSGVSIFFRAFPDLQPLFFDEYREQLPVTSISGTRKAIAAYGSVDFVLDIRSSAQAFWTYLAASPLVPRVATNALGYVTRKGSGRRPQIRPRDNARRYHRLLELALGRILPFDPSLPVDPAAQELARKLLPSGARYVGIAPGPPASHKAWPVDRHLALAARITALGARPVFFIGAHEEEARAWAEKVPGAIVIDGQAAPAGAAQLPGLLHAAFGLMSAVVAVEGGLGHLAATRGVPLATLAGPTDGERWRPVTPYWWLVRAQDFGSHQMTAIPIEAVEKAIAEMLAWSAHPDYRPHVWPAAGVCA